MVAVCGGGGRGDDTKTGAERESQQLGRCLDTGGDDQKSFNVSEATLSRRKSNLGRTIDGFSPLPWTDDQ